MHFIVRFSQNHFLKIINNKMLLTYSRSHVPKTATYDIARGINFYSHIVFRIQKLEDLSFNKCITQLSKCLSNAKC